MKKVETTTARTINFDKDAKKMEFVGELFVNSRIPFYQLDDWCKEEGLTRITNEIFDEEIELLPGINPQKHHSKAIKDIKVFTHSNKEIGFKRISVTNFVHPKLQTYKLTYPECELYRLVVMRRDHFACRMCGDKNALNVYPLKSHKGDPCQKNADKLITLCKYCQKQVEKMLSDGIEPIYFVKK